MPKCILQHGSFVHWVLSSLGFSGICVVLFAYVWVLPIIFVWGGLLHLCILFCVWLWDGGQFLLPHILYYLVGKHFFPEWYATLSCLYWTNQFTPRTFYRVLVAAFPSSTDNLIPETSTLVCTHRFESKRSRRISMALHGTNGFPVPSVNVIFWIK